MTTVDPLQFTSDQIDHLTNVFYFWIFGVTQTTICSIGKSFIDLLYSLIAKVVGVSAKYAVLAILNAAVKHKWAIAKNCKLLSKKISLNGLNIT